MKFMKFGNKFFVKLDKGEEIVECLKDFCREQKIFLGTVSGIGATNKAVIGFFETRTKTYHKREFNEDLEIASLLGNVSMLDKEVYLHLHITLGAKNNISYSGHLNSAVVSAAFEAVIEKAEGKLDRYHDEEIGLNLWKM